MTSRYLCHKCLSLLDFNMWQHELRDSHKLYKYCTTENFHGPLTIFRFFLLVWFFVLIAELKTSSPAQVIKHLFPHILTNTLAKHWHTVCLFGSGSSPAHLQSNPHQTCTRTHADELERKILSCMCRETYNPLYFHSIRQRVDEERYCTWTFSPQSLFMQKAYIFLWLIYQPQMNFHSSVPWRIKQRKHFMV